MSDDIPGPPPATPPATAPAPPPPTSPPPRRGWLPLLIAIVASALVTFGVTALLVNIFGRQQEAKNPFFRVVELTENTVDPAVWGKNFPYQYDSYMRTVDQQRTRYGGSEALPHTPTDADPRTIVARSRIEEDPRLKTMWAGYAFSIDFREERGHAYMLEDQSFTKRITEKEQPGTCLHCHASTYVPYREIGDGDVIKGFEIVNQLPWNEAREAMEAAIKSVGGTQLHPVACIDCHDPETMALRVTRPGFLEAVKHIRDEPDFDVNQDATRQEMRSYVCAQCHVEYYFKGDEKRLTYPWANGLRADQILAYYEEVGHQDWEHKTTGASALKAQHPEFEMWSQGIHARSGVACADCHMPYQRVGAMKISDHHVQSPVLNINNACQTCHKQSEEELRQRVYRIQDTTFELRNDAIDALVALISDLEAAIADGATEAQLAEPRKFQRRAQFLIDFVEAENSMGFHAGQEAARLAAKSIDLSRQGQLALRDAR